MLFGDIFPYPAGVETKPFLKYYENRFFIKCFTNSGADDKREKEGMVKAPDIWFFVFIGGGICNRFVAVS